VGFGAFDAARANLLLARREIEKAYELTEGILRLCDRHGQRGGPLRVAALHCQALYHLHKGDFARAEQTWQGVQDLQGPLSPLLPRTLNYRALTRERRGPPAEAGALYPEA